MQPWPVSASTRLRHKAPQDEQQIRPLTLVLQRSTLAAPCVAFGQEGIVLAAPTPTQTLAWCPNGVLLLDCAALVLAAALFVLRQAGKCRITHWFAPAESTCPATQPG